MKKIKLLLVLLVAIIACQMHGQDMINGINYKAIIKDSNGNILATSPVTIQFIIYEGSELTNNVYEETHTLDTDQNGVIAVNIGEGTTSDDFNLVNWGSTSTLFLNTQIDTGSGLIDLSTTGFKTVPYAMALTGGIDKTYIEALEDRINALEPQPAQIGDFRSGGVVFWLDPTDNTHGLVCALSDYVATVEWGCLGDDLPNVPNVIPIAAGTPLSGPGTEIGDGISNTIGILTDCPSAPAALSARLLGIDWFLPSILELKEMRIHRDLINTTATANGGDVFKNANYWSSTEGIGTGYWAWKWSFWNNYRVSDQKNDPAYVRAVRAF